MLAPSANPHEILALARKLRAGAAELRALGVERIVSALCDAAQQLRGTGALATITRQKLHADTGLHPAMIEWGLCTTLASVEPSVLMELAAPLWNARVHKPVPAELIAVVLAGNVFTACVRGLFLPLLTGAPVIAKTAARDPALALALERALHAADPSVARHLAVLAFDRDDNASLQAFVGQAQVVSVYGSDAAVEAIASEAPQARLLAHGHGISAAYVGPQSLETPDALRDAAARLALDVAAYDQLGCLSPHLVWVHTASLAQAESFARALCDHGLEQLQSLLPRGKLELDAQAAELQWRGIAAASGTLYTGSAHAVSVETGPARTSPGFRNLSVRLCTNLPHFARALTPFATHLKAIGVAGSAELRTELRAELARQHGSEAPKPHVCRLGEMQTPGFDAPADGRPALYGLTR
ncbi:MAG TPA: acyl-CoA reductase [Polyangiales bacterium]